MGICEYEATLSYIARLKPARTTKGALVSKKKKVISCGREFDQHVQNHELQSPGQTFYVFTSKLLACFK